jgi:hypothetical protein
MKRTLCLAFAVSISLSGSVSLLLASAAPAWADTCGEETLFVQKGTLDSAYGSNGEIYVRDRSLSGGCGGASTGAEAHSTAHVENALQTKFAEVGFVEYWDGPPSSPKLWRVFVEGNDGSKPTSQWTYGGFLSTGTIIGPNKWARFKVNNVAGTNTWNFWYEDNVNGGGYTQEGGTPNLNFSNGLAFGETGRVGDPGTGAMDHHENLIFKKCSGTCSWTGWGSNSQSSNGISGYYYQSIASDEYKVCSSSNGCPA